MNSKKGEDREDRMTALLQAQENKCAYCEVKFSQETDPDYEAEWIEPTFDHVVPKSRGGSNNIKNGLAVCWGCNNRKDDKMPTKAQRAVLTRIAPIAFPIYTRLRAERVARKEHRQYVRGVALVVVFRRPAAREYVERESRALTTWPAPE